MYQCVMQFLVHVIQWNHRLNQEKGSYVIFDQQKPSSLYQLLITKAEVIIPYSNNDGSVHVHIP